MAEAGEYQGVIPDDLEDLKNVDHASSPQVGDTLVVTAVDDNGRVHWEAATPSGTSPVPDPTTGNAGDAIVVNGAEDGYELAAPSGGGGSTAGERLSIRLIGTALAPASNQMVDWTGASVLEAAGTSIALVAGVVEVHEDGVYAVTFGVAFGDLTGATHSGISVADDASDATAAASSSAVEGSILPIHSVSRTYFLPADDGGSPNFIDTRYSHNATDPSGSNVTLVVQRLA